MRLETSDGAKADQPAEDLSDRCLWCGYALTGLSARAACPECGTPVARSLYRDDVWCDHAWVTQLRTGASCLLAAVALAAAWGLLAWLKVGRPPFDLAEVLSIPVSVLAVAYADWSLARRVPWRTLFDDTAVVRRVLRACAVACVVVVIATLAPRAVVPHRVMMFALLATWFAGSAAALVQLALLAERIFEPRLARACRWTLGIASAAALMTLVAQIFAVQDPLVRLIVRTAGYVAAPACALLVVAILIEFLILAHEAGAGAGAGAEET